MLVFVRERGEGKTTKLIDWALQGVPIDNFPHWSRLIVTMWGEREAESLRRGLTLEAQKRGLLRHSHRMRDAVWTYEKITTDYALRGTDRDAYEYVIDDMGRLLGKVSTAFAKAPHGVTINGELWQ